MSAMIFFLIFIPILSFILLSVNLILAPHMPYKEKKTPFECGYHSFIFQNRTQFTIMFFVFGLLFLLFDLEIVIMYPYAVTSTTNGIYGLVVLIFFALIVTVGFVFELGKNALSIESKQNKAMLQSSVASSTFNYGTYNGLVLIVLMKYIDQFTLGNLMTRVFKSIIFRSIILIIGVILSYIGLSKVELFSTYTIKDLFHVSIYLFIIVCMLSKALLRSIYCESLIMKFDNESFIINLAMCIFNFIIVISIVSMIFILLGYSFHNLDINLSCLLLGLPLSASSDFSDGMVFSGVGPENLQSSLGGGTPSGGGNGGGPSDPSNLVGLSNNSSNADGNDDGPQRDSNSVTFVPPALASPPSPINPAVDTQDDIDYKLDYKYAQEYSELSKGGTYHDELWFQAENKSPQAFQSYVNTSLADVEKKVAERAAEFKSLGWDPDLVDKQAERVIDLRREESERCVLDAVHHSGVSSETKQLYPLEDDRDYHTSDSGDISDSYLPFNRDNFRE